MRKKVQRKSIRHLPESSDRGQTDAKGLNIRDAITILGGTTGLVVAVLWIAGRSYSAGYFSAMNIPSFQINFSIWEYAEASWQRLYFIF